MYTTQIPEILVDRDGDKEVYLPIVPNRSYTFVNENYQKKSESSSVLLTPLAPFRIRRNELETNHAAITSRL